MSDFFHGWRRNAGYVTLVMAAAFAGVWAINLISKTEWVLFAFLDVEYKLRSTNGSIQFVETVGVKFGPRDDDILFAYPYWGIVCPLTVVSAYLLFWPGKRLKKPVDLD